MDDDLTKTLDECLRILDENVDILSDIEINLDEEKEDQVQPDMQLHNLYDMAEDVSTSARLRAAETRFMKRQSED